MEWLRTHPYASALAGSALLIAAGIFIVFEKSGSAPSSSQPLTWGGAGTVFGSAPTQNSAPQQQNPGGIIQQVQSAAPYTYIPITASQDTNLDATSTDSFDFNGFISLLSAGNKKATAGSTGKGAQPTSAYAFIPGGLVSTSTAQKIRTPLQERLYNYGNDVGSFIQSFEQQYPNETKILTDQIQDRKDTVKGAAVVSLGQALSALGSSLSAMDDGSGDEGGNQSVPSQMRPSHLALAKSYSELGAKLALIPKTQSDTDFIAAINAYNASVDTFTKNYVALANLFAAYGVSFSPEDPGSLFTFTQAAF